MIVSPDAVYLIIRSHYIEWVRGFDAYLKALEINLAQSALGHARIVIDTHGLLIVAGEVLRAGGDPLRLDTAHDRRTHGAGEQRIFGEIFKVSAAERISVDIHTGGEQDIGALARHLGTLGSIQLADELLIPCAREQRADRQERGITMESDAGGAVRCADGRHAFFAQRFKYSAVNCGVAGSAELAVHDIIATAESLKLNILELSREARKSRSVIGDIFEFYALVAREIGSFGQIFLYLLTARNGAQRDRFICFFYFSLFVGRGDKAVERLFRGAVRAARKTLGDAKFRLCVNAYLLAGAHIGAGIDGIVPSFEHIAERRAGFAGVVERRHIGARERHDHPLLFARQKSARFFICGKALCRLAELALRRAVVDLNNLFARGRAYIPDFYGDYYSVVSLHDSLVGQLERSVAKAEAEREHDLFGREGFKISVADEDILGVVVVCLFAKVLRRRIALVAIGNGIGQLAARRHLAGEHLAYGVSALHAALPDIEHGA